jgi:hypothetical protein
MNQPPSSPTHTVTDKEIDDVKGCLATLASIPALLIFMVYEAWVLTLLWSWYVVPTWAGAGELSVAAAYGLLLIKNMVWLHVSSADTEATKRQGWRKSLASGFLVAVLGPTFALVVGWFVHFAMA